VCSNSETRRRWKIVAIDCCPSDERVRLLLHGPFPDTDFSPSFLRDLTFSFSFPALAQTGFRSNETILDPGWFHLAGALLAVEHFNTRNSTVVPQLDNLQCGVSFGNISTVDTGTNSHSAMETVVEVLQTAGPPDAIAGPYNEIPALELSVLATGMKTPIVSHRAFDYNLLLPERHPFFTQLFADFYSEMDFVSSYLQHIGRTNYVAVVYSSSASVMQKVDMLRVILDHGGFDQVRTFSYYSSAKIAKEFQALSDQQALPDRSIRTALTKVKETGFRTIVLMSSEINVDAPEIGAAAADLQLDKGNHMWVLSGGVAEQSSLEIRAFLNEASQFQSDFMKGAAYLFPYDGYELNERVNLRDLIQQQDSGFFQRVQNINPIPTQNSGELQAVVNETLPIQKLAHDLDTWMQGLSFMYDSVMTIGLGACKATSNQNGNIMTGVTHLEGIRSVSFEGASGTVEFGNIPGSPGSRIGSTIAYGVSNFLPGDG
jgi:hypothetical protein